MAKTITGTVTSNKNDKTIVITEHVRKTHPLYKKQYTVTSKFMAHDENNECQVGDKVIIEESRPLSARKRYNLKKVIQKAELSQEDLGAIEKSAQTETETETEEEEAK